MFERKKADIKAHLADGEIKDALLLLEGLNEVDITINCMKKILSSINPHNPHRKHLQPTLNYFLSRSIRSEVEYTKAL